MKENKAKKLDQFYTNPKLSDDLIKTLDSIFHLEDYCFIEPSAGSGNFVDSLIRKGIPKKNIIAYDIDKKRTFIKECDYLTKKIYYKKNRINIGNPPFGKRGKLALNFLNKSLKESDIVAMILPNTFTRYSVQKHINKDTKLIYSSELPNNSFLINDRSYNVKCVFQIWVKNKFKTFAGNIRLKKSPQIRHEDFQTWIHNNTQVTLKYFDKNKYKWNYAIHRQGFYNYNKLITNPLLLKTNRQYMFIKINSKIARRVIKKIDFNELSKGNTQTPGYSTYDFVRAYKEVKKQIIKGEEND